MSSLITNASAMTAMQTLAQIGRDLGVTQERISTGKKINTAADNAAYWSIATTMQTDSKALGTIREALSLGAAKIDTAAAAVDYASGIVADIRNKLIAAKEGSVDKAKIQEEIAALQGQLKGLAEGASFSGANWLHVADGGTAPGTQSILSGITRVGGSFETTSISVNTSDFMLVDEGSAANGILSRDRTGTNGTAYSIAGGESDISLSASTTASQLDDMIEAAEGALAGLTSAGSKLGSLQKRISLQDDFLGKMVDIIDQGVSRLVDADMTKESARLAALQVQQQLGIQALQIANANSQNILALFR